MLKLMNAFRLMPLRSYLQAGLGFGLLILLSAPVSNAGSEAEKSEPSAAQASPKDDQPVTAGPVIKLAPYVVEEPPPHLCFGVSLSVWKNVATGKVTAIYINRVKEGSDALEAGFGPRTRIYRINGKPVEEMSASFNNGNELNQIFINRKIGEKITVEAVPEGSNTSKTVTLMERSIVNLKFRSIDAKRPDPDRM
jgi:hypothetical protein